MSRGMKGNGLKVLKDQLARTELRVKILEKCLADSNEEAKRYKDELEKIHKQKEI